ncbi:hypothetical protein [Tropicibacter sp. S64]|uniref:hypothetical protein n=1 Tax=Tropicibacter sp. S64 TaxID=3415122 RepID=UPI003C7A954C
MRTAELTCVLALTAIPALADNVINNHTIIRDNLCVGSGCSDPESYVPGEAIARLKAGSPRLEFIDMSSPTSSYPYYDWRLRANEDFLNGENLFAVENLTIGTKPFVIQGDTPTNSLYLAGDGALGLGTSLPQTELHIVSPSSPTIRFEQSSAGGLPAQAWDMLFNHGNMFIRDINLNTTPFSIFKNAPTNALRITGNGDIGMGTSGVGAALHIWRANGTAKLRIEETSRSIAVREMFEMRNNGGSYFTLTNTASGNSWYYVHENNTQGRFLINHSDGGVQMALTRTGDMTVSGRYFAGATQLDVPDFVFGEDYALKPLSEVRAFIEKNGHLPEVPSAAEIRAEGLDMTGMQMTLLQKVEELTLYTLDQEDVIQDQKATIATLEDRLRTQDEHMTEMEAMLRDLASRL